MKKRGQPPDLVERMAMWEAREGDPSRLARHLRDGIASPEERALAADLLEGKIRPRRPKLGAPTRAQQDEMAVVGYFATRLAKERFIAAKTRPPTTRARDSEVAAPKP